MGKDTRIEWTHHTFNPWWGCTKVSQACKFCYAEVWAKRTGGKLWGPKAERRFFGDEHWKQPLIWDRQAKEAGIRRRVFCASMADVFEYRAELQPWRERLWDLIEKTPNLDWLLLTKRPQRIALHNRWVRWPANVWLGTTVENQKTAAERIPHLLGNTAHVRFLSCEPLMGPVNLADYLRRGIQWVIAGGESGGRSRPSHPRWISDLRDQCSAESVPFLFKQWGNWAPHESKVAESAKRVHIFPDGEAVIRRTKTEAGRLLQGRTWDQVPESFNGSIAAIRFASSEQEASARF